MSIADADEGPTGLSASLQEVATCCEASEPFRSDSCCRWDS